ncbi:MAG: dTDP-4-amino-4,6-dideoxygalactose transaminase [Opitutales bacterium]|nr:dTDP-4-amino-4,6-dideoxygalactose transaminase [Opitutales bacterium]MCH8539774.1 dTDP-4-amino-4,6-dideoxygalactose transaminase [Opitutales bacterium]
MKNFASTPTLQPAVAKTNGTTLFPTAYPQPRTKPRAIPFNQPSTEGQELEFMEEAVRKGQLCGNGPFMGLCQTWIESMLGVGKALLTTSCTDALEMSAILLNIKPGDEVILPSFTFVSTANAFVLHGARPVFADIRPDTLNLDEKGLESLIGPRTRAVVAVHYAGVGCEMEALQSIVDKWRLVLIEDNAHGFLGQYRDRFLSTFGALSTLSFHETKNFTCGEGGALLINDESFFERAEIIREKGTNRKLFLDGQVDAYTWVDVGSSFLPSDLLAAFLYAQLLASGVIQAKRRNVWNYYHDHLRGWALEHQVRVPSPPSHCEQSWHMFYLMMPTPESRRRLIAHLKSQGIQAVFHYLPLHLSKMGQKFGGRPGMCPVAEWASERLVRLPFHNNLSETDQERIVEAVREFRP